MGKGQEHHENRLPFLSWAPRKGTCYEAVGTWSATWGTFWAPAAPGGIIADNTEENRYRWQKKKR